MLRLSNNSLVLSIKLVPLLLVSVVILISLHGDKTLGKSDTISFASKGELASVRGLVLDEIGFPIPASKMEVYQDGTKIDEISVNTEGWYFSETEFDSDTGYSLRATAPGFLSNQEDILVKPSYTLTVDFFLERETKADDPLIVKVHYTPNQLEVSVNDDTGNGVNSGWVTVYRNGDLGPWERVDYGLLKQNGEYQFSGLSPDSYIVRAFVDGYPPGEVEMENQESGVKEFTLIRSAPDERRDAVRRLNWHRIQAGLSPVRLDNGLNLQNQLHAEYFIFNSGHPTAEGLGGHDEYPFLPGYSAEGLMGGRSSVIAGGSLSTIEAVDVWINSLYHRLGPMSPGLRRVGYARLAETINALNVFGYSPKVEPGVVRYPAPGQANFPPIFPGYELPNPLPPGSPIPTGNIITLQFVGNPLPKVAGVKASLHDLSGREVGFYLSSPEQPANSKYPTYQGGAISLVPHKPLDVEGQYVVTVSGLIEGKPFVDAWTFATGSYLKEIVLDDLAPPQTRPEAIIESLPHLVGRVTDPEGNPVTKGMVRILKGNQQVGFSWIDTQDGSFATGIISPGTYRVTITPDISFLGEEREIEISSGKTMADFTVLPQKLEQEALGFAYRKPVSASFSSPGIRGEFLVDGDTHSFQWIVDPFVSYLRSLKEPDDLQSYGQWIEIDLEEAVEIDRIHVFPLWYGGLVHRYRIAISPDGHKWEEVVDRTEDAVDATSVGVPHRIKPTVARFVRLQTLPTLEYSAASFLEIRVFKTGLHAADGLLDDLLGLPFGGSIADPEGDATGPENFDIKAIYAYVYGDNLIVASDYYHVAKKFSELNHTLRIQVFDQEGKKINYQIQTNPLGSVDVHRYRDGTPNEEWERIKMGGKLHWGLSEGAEWKVPLNLLKDARTLKIQYTVAGHDSSGESVWNADSIGWLMMDLSPAKIVVSPHGGKAPLKMAFGIRKEDEGPSITSYAWDFQGDGVVDNRDQGPTYIYDKPGTYRVRLEVEDERGFTYSDTAMVVVNKDISENSLFVDGEFWDWEMLDRGAVHSFSDPEGDSKAEGNVYDIKDISFFEKGGIFYAAVRYHNDVATNEDSDHTFTFRTSGTEWDSQGRWIQLWSTGMRVREIIEGEPWEDWPIIEVDRSIFQEACCIYGLGEWAFPLDLLGNPELISVRYDVGESGDTVDSPKFKTSLAKPDKFYAEGDLSDLLKLPNLISYSDPQGDTRFQDSFDIKGLFGSIQGGDLIIGADFYHAGKSPERLQQTIHIQAYIPEKINYQLQTSTAGWVVLFRFKDGQPFQEWEKVEIPQEFDWGLSPEGGEWKIPLAILGDVERIEVNYTAGGYDESGKVTWGDDQAKWIRLDL